MKKLKKFAIVFTSIALMSLACIFSCKNSSQSSSDVITITFQLENTLASIQETATPNSFASEYLPADPEKEGAYFMGWHTVPQTTETAPDETKRFSSASKITQSITVYAWYTKTKYCKVSFKTNDGLPLCDEVFVKANTSVKKPAFEFPHKKFIAWQKDGSDWNFSTAISEPIELFAKTNEFIFTFKNSGKDEFLDGSTSDQIISAQSGKIGSDRTPLFNLVKNSKIFMGLVAYCKR